MKNSLRILYCLCIVTNIAVNSYAQTPAFSWAKQMKGKDNEATTAIALDASGNVYATGDFQGTVDFDPSDGVYNLTSEGMQDIYITKFDATGNFVWAKRIGGAQYDQPSDITTDTEGNLYIGGYFEETVDFDPGIGNNNRTSIGKDDIFIVKMDSNGSLLWVKTIGGISDETVTSIAVDAHGIIYTTGFFQSTVDFNPGAGVANLNAAGGLDAFIATFDTSGVLLWAKNIGGALNDEAYALAVATSGNVYITGSFRGTSDFDPGTGVYNLSSAGDYDIFILKVDAAGNFVWARNMGGTSADNGRALVIDALENIYATGQFSRSADFDPSNNTFTLLSGGKNDVFLLKLNTDGNLVWAKQLAGAEEELAFAIAKDAKDNIYVTGFFNEIMDCDPGIGTHNLQSYHTDVAYISYDIYVAKFDSSGAYLWAGAINSNQDDFGNCIKLDADGNIYVGGGFSGKADFDPGVGIFTMTSLSDFQSFDAFILKLRPSGTSGAEEYTAGQNLSLYPQPTDGLCTLVLPALSNATTVEIYNSLGIALGSEPIHNETHTLDMHNYAEGVYILKIMQHNRVLFTRTILKY